MVLKAATSSINTLCRVKTYLPAGLLDFPSVIQNTFLKNQTVRNLNREVFVWRSKGLSLPETLISKLEWYPEVVSTMLVNALVREKDVSFLLDQPVTGFRILVENFGKLASLLEPRLLEHSEAAEMILLMRRRAAGGETQADGAYLECMVDDPNRLIRSLGPDAHSNSRRLEIQSESTSRKLESAAWAYCYLESDPNASLDSTLVDILRTSDEYAYLAARTLRERQVDPSTWSQLLTGITDPRWAFHILRDDLAGDQHGHVMKVITQSPPWVCEYCVTAGLQENALDQIYCETVRRSHDHPCIEELHSWYHESTLERLGV